MKFRFIDLFAGIGGFHQALGSLEGTCVFASEIDDRARTVYHNNYGLMPIGDIRDITGPNKSDEMITWAVPDHDILCGGFPCQPFSLAGVSARNSLGKEHGFLDRVKGTLFFDICRIARVKRPKVLFLENVANLKSHDKGRTFQTIKSTIENDLGYKLYADVLNSETLVPQRRKRLFFVAFRDHDVEFNFPNLDGPKLPLSGILEEDVDERYTISDRAWAGHQRRNERNRMKGNGFNTVKADLTRPSNTIVARYYKDGKECLIPQSANNPRMLTPRECARLQGFPEDFILHRTKSTSYQQFGNAVTVPLVRLIGQNILSALEGRNDGQANKSDLVKEYGLHQVV